MDTMTWAAEEFGGARLGDERRTSRLVRLAAAVASAPSGLVTRVVQKAAEREAAYRFVENDAVSASAIGASMSEASARRCAKHGRVIVGIDQSTVSITDRRRIKGLGRTGGRVTTGRRRGFEVMSALATSPEGESLGVVGQAWHLRSEERSPHVRNDKRSIELRESALWLRCMRAVVAVFKTHAPETRPWFQLDRGADANHVLEAAMTLDADFTIRSAHDRRLDTGGRLLSAMRKRPVLGHVHTTLLDSHAPAGVARPRRATLSVRARRVVLRLQDYRGQRHGSLALTAVHVCELKRGRRSRIEWFLLTNIQVRSLDEAWTVVQAYRGRWRVEEFHRAWKSGVCDVEISQLRSANAFKRWATILAAVAARAEHLKTRSRTEPDVLATDELTRDEIDAAILLTETNKHRVGAELTLEQAVELIAFVGGYTGRKNSGGPPGATVIARGLHDVTVAARALAADRRRSG